MEEFLSNLYSNSSTPFLSALILGLLTAISPCPLATNITAIGFISKDIEDKNRVFLSGIVYTLGRALAYSLIALIIYLGASKMSISGVFQKYGERIIGPLLILIGLFMLNVIRINFPAFTKLTDYFQKKSKKNYWDTFLLGNIFAFAFCPYSGVLYFGMLIPMTISSASGLYLPIVFAIATGLPVIIIAYLLAFSISSIGGFYNKVKIFEKWFRRVIAVVFILVGLYYVKIFFM